MASGNQIDIFLEWSLTCTIIMGFYSMALDVEKFDFVYESSKLAKQEPCYQQEISEVD